MDKKTTNNWGLAPSKKIERKILHEEFGGRTQGGIGPSKSSPNVFVFTDPIAGAKHGYFDGWGSDGCFHYTGEGQRGDQVMKSGNASILRHQQEGRALRLFNGVRGTVTYMGEFKTDDLQPFYFTDAPESGGGPVRQVIVFRLRPITKELTGTPTIKVALMANSFSEEVPIEGYFTERMIVEPSREPYEAERKEAELVRKFSDYVRAKGLQIVRSRILPPNEAKPIFTDLFIPNKNILVEAKGTVERNSIRMAIGQLADYRRFLGDPSCAILVPSKPREDLLNLCDSQAIGVIWLTPGGFDCHGITLT